MVWCVLSGGTLSDWDNCVSNLWIERIGAFPEYAVNAERWCGFGAGSMISNLSTSSSCFLRLLLSKTRRTMATETPKTARPPTTPPTILPMGVLLRLGPDIPVCGTPDSMTELAEMVLLGRLRKGVLDKYLAALLVMATYVSARWENKPPSEGLQGKHVQLVVETELP